MLLLLLLLLLLEKLLLCCRCRSRHGRHLPYASAAGVVVGLGV
jgi:hypothetical protein